jgi:curli biogenesis system outer membrane secretion channel CsgG
MSKRSIEFVTTVALFGSVFALLPACPKEKPYIIERQALPPLSQSLESRKQFHAFSQRFKIAVLTFIDQTGRGELVQDTVADVLTTELYRVGRFDLYDRGDLTQEVKTEVETHKEGMKTDTTTTRTETLGLDTNQVAVQSKAAERKSDAVLLGYITTFNYAPGSQTSGSFEIDFRIVNNRDAIGGTGKMVVFSSSGKIRFRTDEQRQGIELERDDVQRIAKQIHAEFPDYVNRTFKVIEMEGPKITINVGLQDGVKQGFNGYVVEKNEKLGTNNYLAGFTVVNVFPKASTAYIWPELEPPHRQVYLDSVRPGSECVIK